MKEITIPADMQGKKLIFLFILSIFTCFSPLNVLSQGKNRPGFSLTADKTSSSGVRVGFGASFERLLTTHHSVETCIYYRSFIDDDLTIRVPTGANSSGLVRFSILQKFITIPLLYSYKSAVINFSAGPALDIYLGWKEKKRSPSSFYTGPLQFYQFDNKLLWGMMIRISKTIKLSNKLLVEPDIHFNPIFTTYSLYSNKVPDRQYYGAAFTVKYIL